MIVRFSPPNIDEVPITDPRRSFIVGKTYLVFGILFRPGGHPPMVAIRRESDGLAGLVESQWIIVMDAAIPPGWCFVDHGNGSHSLLPNEFTGDFWDRYHGDYSEAAEAEFELVAHKIAAFHAGETR